MGYDNERSGYIAIDIETIASPAAAAYLDPVRAPSTYKDPVKIAEYCAEKMAERIASAGLEPDLCEIVAVGWRVLGGAPTATDVLSSRECSENKLIDSLFDAIGSRLTVGYNSLAFDLPCLIRRAQLLGITPPEFNLDRYRTPHVDLMERLSFHGRITTRSLTFYARRFGLPMMDTTSGRDIAALVAAGNWSAVEAHCAADVTLTAALAERLGWVR